MEWRWNEEESLTTHRLRHRLQIAYTFPQPLGPLTRVYANNEWLTDLHRMQRTENRLIPLSLTFKTGTKSDLDLFYMILSSRAQGTWGHESIIGTWWRVRF